MPVPGGTTRKLSKAFLAPAQELVALAVALIFDVDVLLKRLGRAELVDHHGVVDDEVDGDERVDLLRIAAELGPSRRAWRRDRRRRGRR
jgi:hypothetical protein